MTFRPGRIPFALMALLALSVATFGSGTVAAGAPVRVALAAAAVKASPSKLTFDAIGADHVKPFVLSTSASGLKASVIDPTICSVAPSAVPTDPNTRTFVVTPLAPGTTTMTVLDASGATIATVPVTVVLAGATPVVSAPPNNTGLFAGIGAAAIGLVVLLSHGGSSTSSVSAPTTPPVVTPTPIEVTPTPVGVTATPTAVGATPTPTAIGATATPTPTPLPTQTPIPATPTPGPLKVNPTTFSFVVGEAPTTGTFTAAEVGYTGQFTVTSGNTADATVSPASGTGPSANFTITAVGPGTTLVTVKDAMGNEATVTVTVTQTNVVVNRRSARNAPGRNPQRRSP